MRTRSAAPPIQFTVDQKIVEKVKEEREQEEKKKKSKKRKISITDNDDDGVNGVTEKVVIGNGVTNGVEDEEEDGVEGGVPMVKGKIDTESQAYKDALMACSRDNREACAMCSA